MIPSSPGISTAALISSLHPSNFASNAGFFVVQNLSFVDFVAGLISAAISDLTTRFDRRTRQDQIVAKVTDMYCEVSCNK